MIDSSFNETGPVKDDGPLSKKKPIRYKPLTEMWLNPPFQDSGTTRTKIYGYYGDFYREKFYED